MSREKLKIEYLELLNKKLNKEEKIIEDAKQKGVWKPGLDSNRELFIEIEREFTEKIEELKAIF